MPMQIGQMSDDRLILCIDFLCRILPKY